MKNATVFSIPLHNANGFSWRWRCVDGTYESNKVFLLYHDCLMDAQRRGYEVELTHAQGLTAPGGKPHSTL